MLFIFFHVILQVTSEPSILQELFFASMYPTNDSPQINLQLVGQETILTAQVGTDSSTLAIHWDFRPTGIPSGLLLAIAPPGGPAVHPRIGQLSESGFQPSWVTPSLLLTPNPNLK